MGDQVTLERHALAYDGAWHHALVIAAGLDGLTTTTHGAADRWDWGVTVQSLGYALQRHRMLQERLAELTPDQRAALWADPSPEAAELRRIHRAA